MNHRLALALAAGFLSLSLVPAHAGTASAAMEVRFVVKPACTVDSAGAAPTVSCNDASPYRVVPAASLASSDDKTWTVTF